MARKKSKKSSQKKQVNKIRKVLTTIIFICVLIYGCYELFKYMQENPNGTSSQITTTDWSDTDLPTSYEGQYYKSIDMESDSLFSDLKKITKDTHHTEINYGDVKEYTKYSDVDPTNKNNIILLYSRASISGEWVSGGKTWNREHVWPKSLSGGLYNEMGESTKGAGADLHHLRPADPTINSTRNNTRYGEIENFSGSVSEIKYNNVGTGNFYIGDTVYEPRDDIKGDIARILLYLYTRYYDEGTLKVENVINTKEKTESSAFELLVKWDESDPADPLEFIRNNYIETLQGNRNPFIDNKGLARKLFIK